MLVFRGVSTKFGIIWKQKVMKFHEIHSIGVNGWKIMAIESSTGYSWISSPYESR